MNLQESTRSTSQEALDAEKRSYKDRPDPRYRRLGSTSASACDWDDCGNGCGSYGYYAAPVHYARPAYAYYAPPVYYAAPAYYAAPRLHVLWASFRGCYYGGQWAANFDRRKGFVAAGRPAAGQGFYTHAAKNGPGWNKTPAANLGIQVRPTSVTNHPQAMSNDPTANAGARGGYVPIAYYGSRR